MTTTDVLHQYPAWASDGLGDIHFADYNTLTLRNDPQFTVDLLTYRCFSYNPVWLQWLMHLRNALARMVGWKSATAIEATEKGVYQVGDVLDIFRVLKRDADVLVMGEDDRGLNFRILTRVLRDDEAGKLEFRISTLVHLNNSSGRIYFAMVKPFHHLIMKAVINRLRKLST